MDRRIWCQLEKSAVPGIGVLPGLLMIGLVVCARLTGLLQVVELRTLDLFLRWRPTEPIDERIVIVRIDRSDVQAIGNYPIPDEEIAQLLERLQQYTPAAIGLNIRREVPVEPGHAQLQAVFAAHETFIAIERVLPPKIRPPRGLNPAQVGFDDYPYDADLSVRRQYLGIPTDEGYKFSLSLRLADAYLKQKGFTLGNGLRDENAMRFYSEEMGSTELPLVYTHSGSYVGIDDGGVQVLLNYRSNPHAFRTLSLQDIKTNNFDPDWLRDRIIIIGLTDPDFSDKVKVFAISDRDLSDQRISGVEFQAHAVSQITSAVLDGRPLLKSWYDFAEYLWIIAWGGVSIYFSYRRQRSPVQHFVELILVGLSLLGTSAILLLVWGWWIPIIPPLLALALGDVACIAFKAYDQALRSRLNERQQTIERTFDVIHNGPLQTLASLLRQVQDSQIPTPQLLTELDELNQEIRAVGERLKQEALSREESLYLSSKLTLDLKSPIHELFYQVYSSTLERDLPGFKTLKVKIRQFDAIEEEHLSLDEKRGLCRFLEEALCNVGKHATGVTRVSATGKQSQGWYTLCVTDNGPGVHSDIKGQGTKQVLSLKTKLKGQFKRESLSPKGTLCELSWPLMISSA
jgi:CHASE2 domain-containing sensor protein/two-component sensor histidine kinase